MEERYYDMKSLPSKEVAPGVKGKFAHSKEMTIAWWEIEKDALLKMHSHDHEQVVNVIEGTLQVIVGDRTWILTPGSVLVIPSGVPHEAKGVTSCRVIDVFYPVREDYKE
jgi:quercetin dioxygenase-like cupin family protein